MEWGRFSLQQSNTEDSSAPEGPGWLEGHFSHLNLAFLCETGVRSATESKKTLLAATKESEQATRWGFVLFNHPRTACQRRNTNFRLFTSPIISWVVKTHWKGLQGKHIHSGSPWDWDVEEILPGILLFGAFPGYPGSTFHWRHGGEVIPEPCQGFKYGIPSGHADGSQINVRQFSCMLLNKQENAQLRFRISFRSLLLALFFSFPKISSKASAATKA